MEPAWVPGGYDPIIINGHQGRPAQRRGRFASEHADHRSQRYYQDNNGLLVPAAAAGPVGYGRVRAASASDHRRPAQIVINNEFENHSPQRSPQRDPRRRSHGHDYHYEDYSSDDWDERAHSPRRHRSRRRSHHRRSPSRTPSPYEPYDFEKEKMKAKLDELEKREQRKEEEERARARYEEEQLIKEAKKAQKKKEEEALKKKAVEEWHIKEAEEQIKKAEEKKKADEEYNKRLKKDLEKSGLDDEEIERILKGKKKEHAHLHVHGHPPVMDLTRPTYIRVHRKHLSPQTLDLYDLPWDWDEKDTEYIVVKRWIPEHEQDMLFEHTRSLREKKQLTDATVELKKERDKMFLVRKPSSSRKRSHSRSWRVV